MSAEKRDHLRDPVDFRGFTVLMLKASGLAYVGTFIGAIISIGSKKWDQPWMLWVSYLITFSILAVSIYLAVRACLRWSGRTMKS